MLYSSYKSIFFYFQCLFELRQVWRSSLLLFDFTNMFGEKN